MSFSETLLRVRSACERARRDPAGVRLVAVSKLQPPESIRRLLQSGQRDFGENYVQELTGKMGLFPEDGVRWHLIGHLQKNKVKLVSGRCERIHSVDSLELARILSEKALALGHVEKILLQVNLAGEASKEGFSAEVLRADWPALQAFRGLQIFGLMTMPPLQNLPEENRVHFSRLRNLLEELRSSRDGSFHPMNELSMGTSQDFEVAIEEGATWIRVGTLVFGERPRQRS